MRRMLDLAGFPLMASIEARRWSFSPPSYSYPWRLYVVVADDDSLL